MCLLLQNKNHDHLPNYLNKKTKRLPNGGTYGTDIGAVPKNALFAACLSSGSTRIGIRCKYPYPMPQPKLPVYKIQQLVVSSGKVSMQSHTFSGPFRIRFDCNISTRVIVRIIYIEFQRPLLMRFDQREQIFTFMEYRIGADNIIGK